MPIDPELVRHFVIGLAVGIVVVSTLSFFPGKPLGITYGNETMKDDDDDKDETVDPPTTETNGKSEQLYPSRTKRPDGVTAVENNTIVNPHCLLNTGVYLAIFAVMIYIWEIDYNGSIMFWFSRLFPREAETLGLT